jgi:hypothetical protein
MLVLEPLRRKRKRRKPRMLHLTMKPRSSTRTARSCVVTSETVANVNSGMNVTSPTRQDLPLATPNLVDEDVEVEVNPRLLVSATTSVTTSLANMVMNASSNMVRTTSARLSNLVLNARQLGNATNSVTKESVNSEINADSLTTAKLEQLTVGTMRATKMRATKRLNHK